MHIRSGVELWGQQKLMSTKMHDAESFVVAGCGTGKTLSALTAIEGAHRALIVTIKPALRSVWDEDIREFTDGDPLILDQGTILDRNETLREASRTRDDLIVVSNYETAAKLSLDRIPWDVVVLDESHRVKSHNAKMSIELARMCWQADVKVCMTGTGWDDRPTDVFGQVRFLGPQRYGNALGSRRLSSWSQFFERYVTYRKMENVKIPVGYKNLDELRDKIAPIFLYIDRDKWLKLTKVTDIKRRVTLSDQHYKQYEALRDDMYAEMEHGTITADNQLVLNTRLHQIAGGYYQPDDRGPIQTISGGAAKLEALEGIAEELGEEPFVIFTRFTHDIERIRASMDRLGKRTLEISGRTDEHRDWRQGRGQILVANIQAGSAGIDLTRACYGVFYSTGYSNTDYTQARFRMDRPGQTRPVTFYTIIASNTIDVEIADTLTMKRHQVRKLL